MLVPTRRLLLAAALTLCCGACVHADPFLTDDAPGRSPWAAADGRPGDAELAACLAVLQAQREAWNSGDLEAFAAGYQRSDALVFSGPDGVRQGFDDMLARYRERYADRAAMGQLSFDDLLLTPLGRGQVLARGTWILERAADRPWGRFVLVLVQTDDGWRVRLDHTTAEGDARAG